MVAIWNRRGGRDCRPESDAEFEAKARLRQGEGLPIGAMAVGLVADEDYELKQCRVKERFTTKTDVGSWMSPCVVDLRVVNLSDYDPYYCKIRERLRSLT